VKVFIRNRDYKIPAFANDTKPVAQPLDGIDQVLQAVAAVDEVLRTIGDAVQKLRISIIPVPCPDILHQREEFLVENQWIGLAADIQPFSNEISADEIGIAKPALNRFAAFFHHRPQFCSWNVRNTKWGQICSEFIPSRRISRSSTT